MKKILILLCFSFSSHFLYSQHEMEIIICDEFKNETNLFKLSLVQGYDTLLIPSIGDAKYLLPDIIFEDNNETMILIVESCKYFYELNFLKEDFKFPVIKFCIEKKRERKGELKWDYTNYHGRNLSGYTKKVRK